jgi:hypothetical protein
VLWIKELPQAVGADVHAVRAATSAFFTGLAVGSWFLRRHADRPARLLGFYCFRRGDSALWASMKGSLARTRHQEQKAPNILFVFENMALSGLSNPFTSSSNPRLII